MGPYKQLEAEGLTLILVLSCLETGFLPYSSLIISLLDIPVSFQTQYTHLEFFACLFVRFVLIMPPNLAGLSMDPVFTLNFGFLMIPHLPFHPVESYACFLCAVRTHGPCHHLFINLPSFSFSCVLISVEFHIKSSLIFPLSFVKVIIWNNHHFPVNWILREIICVLLLIYCHIMQNSNFLSPLFCFLLQRRSLFF